MLHRLRSRRVLAVLGTLLVLGAVAAYIVYDRVIERPGDISNPDVEFVDPTPTPEGKKGKFKRVRTFSWPRYGFTKDHNRNYQPGYTLKAPFERRWKRKASALTEFPPVLHNNVLFQISDDGWLRALAVENGKTLWKKRLGRLSASSPAVDGKRVYVTVLQAKAGRTGRVVAVRERDGKVAWSRRLPSRTESSPLIHDGKVYFGSEDGTLYALWARTGNVAWTYKARGAIKGSPTLSSDGILYFGDYGGWLHAVRKGGRPVWAKPIAARSFRGGRFYATAAVAYGRVFIGSTDGREYAVSARTGSIAWARQTGDFVYSSAAVANVAGRGPTVFFGSYDGRLYALDAKSGRTRWTYNSGSKISGSPTIVGTVVYFSDLGTSRTYGIDTRSGRAVFRRQLGGYDPVISDGRHIFVTGRRSVTAWLASNAPKKGTVRQPPGTALPQAPPRKMSKAQKRAERRKSARRRARRTAARYRAALRRCSRRPVARDDRKRCRSGVHLRFAVRACKKRDEPKARRRCRAAAHRRAALRRCERVDTRRARARCRNRISRQ